MSTFERHLALWVALFIVLGIALGHVIPGVFHSALIGASNFFELAVAAAIGLFGSNSGAALATVVGVLIEVPVMLSVARIVNRSKGWHERGSARCGHSTKRA